MNDWAAKQSFFRNTGNRLIHPNPSLPLVFRLVGYLFRVVILVFIFTMIGRFGLKKYVMSSGFSEKAAASFAELLKADEFEASTLLWKGKRVSLKQFKATGKQEAVFRTLKADYLQFESHPLKLLGEVWDLGEIVISRLEIDFRSGAVTEVPVAGLEEGVQQLLMAGLGSVPDFGKLKFGKISVKEAALTWGLSETTKGGYLGSFEFQHGDAPGEWRINLTGGRFFQNWLMDVNVEKMSIQRSGDKLIMKDGMLSFDDGGSATAEGELLLGGIPETDLTIQMAKVNITNFIPDAFSDYLDGYVSGPLKLKGSINTRAGIEMNGAFTMVGGRIRSVSVFESLALLTQVSRFRQMPLSSGSFDLKTGGDELSVNGIDIKSDELAHLKGGFAMNRSVVLTAEEQMINEQLNSEGKALKRAPYHVSGELEIGVVPEKLDEFRTVADKYFKKKEGGFEWMSLHLTGEAPDLTNSVYEKMVEDVRIARGNR